MLAELRAGPITTSDGAINPGRADRTGAVVSTDGHGRYYESAYRGNLYLASNQAGVATLAGLTALTSSFILYNPVGSGVNLVVNDVIGQVTAAPAATAAVWLTANVTAGQAAPTSATTLISRSAFIGTAGGKGVAYSAASLAAAPVVIRPLASLVTSTAVGMAQTWWRDELAGSVIVPPTYYISVQASAAITIACGMSWEELPV